MKCTSKERETCDVGKRGCEGCAYDETADEIFEKLGYKKSLTQLKYLKYKKDDDNIFYFRIDEKEFYKSGEWDSMCDSITMQELKAINKKVKELKWNE